MSTRSTITIKRTDGTQTSIYCHWDGYIEYNGVILQMYYDTPEKVEKLLALGDLSSLGYKTEPTGEHSFEKPEEDVCVAYHRDRGEEFRQSGGKDEFNYIYDEQGRYWSVEIETFTRRTKGINKLGLNYFIGYKSELLIDAILEREEGINEMWRDEEPDVINECIGHAVNARAEIIKEQQELYDGYYNAYCN